MRWKALATDFDGTLAEMGAVSPATREAIAALRRDGGKVVLVTGRLYSDFSGLGISPEDLADLVVAENGALLVDPRDGTAFAFGTAPPSNFASELIRRGANPVTVGRTIVATVEPFETLALELVREMGLEHQIIFNKGAVMILPPGVNKASGLVAAAQRLGLSPSDFVGVGDGENDHALLQVCGLAAAVANALPALLQEVRYVTTEPAGAGVTELIEAMRSGALDSLVDAGGIP
jgi:hypothetical protein